MAKPRLLICPSCGQSLPDDELPAVHLSATQRAIYRTVARAGAYGIESKQLLAHLYGDDINGGPDTGMKCMHVHIYHLNQRLAAVGQRVEAGRGLTTYVLYR